MKRRGQRGFTLLELVLALSIVAAMLAIVFGGLRVGVRAWQRGEERTESQQHARSLNALLALSLGGTTAYLGAAPAGVQPEVLFQGEPDRLSFVTVSAPFPLPAPIAFTAVTLSVDEGDKPGLAIREKALPNDDPFEDVAPIVVDPIVHRRALPLPARHRGLLGRDAGTAPRSAPCPAPSRSPSRPWWAASPSSSRPSACPSGSPRREPRAGCAARRAAASPCSP